MKLNYETLMNHLQEYDQPITYPIDQENLNNYQPKYVAVSHGNHFCDSSVIQESLFTIEDMDGNEEVNLDVAFVYYNTKHRRFLVYAWTEERLLMMLRDPIFYFELKSFNLYDDFLEMKRFEITDSFLEIIQLIICLEANVEQDLLDNLKLRIESDFIRLYNKDVESFLVGVGDYKLTFIVFNKDEKMTVMRCNVRMPKTYFETSSSLCYPLIQNDSVSKLKTNLFRRMS